MRPPPPQLEVVLVALQYCYLGNQSGLIALGEGYDFEDVVFGKLRQNVVYICTCTYKTMHVVTLCVYEYIYIYMYLYTLYRYTHGYRYTHVYIIVMDIYIIT